ncbi:MAG TPA: hypothetical protein VLZ75_00750 [Chitinophagales bacterium]|nr:hypothetical protein [Chitinophagales bacterium]
MRNSYLSGYLIVIISFIFTQNIFAQTSYSKKISQHIDRYAQDSILTNEETMEYLKALEDWATQPHPINDEYFLLLDNYLTYIKKSTYKKYAGQVYNDIFSQALNIIKASSDPSIDMTSFSYSLLPDYYSAVKILIPAEVSKYAVLNMAKERPQELIGQFSKLDYALDAKDLEIAVLASPHVISQFMHYNNLVKTELLKSTQPEIKLLFEIYKKYRYSEHPYYLLPYIVNNKISIENAEELSKNEYSLINYLLPLVIDTMPLARVSIQQRWDELTSKYVKIIHQNKYSAPNTWKMEALDQITDSSRTRILFVTHNMLSPLELDAFMKWISFKNKLQPLPEKALDKISLKDIYILKDKVYKENLQATWVQLWGNDSLNTYIRSRRAQATPKQLESIKNGSFAGSKSEVVLVPVAKPKVPEFIIKSYYFNLSDQDKTLMRWKNDPMTALDKISNWIDEPYSDELLQYIAHIYPLEIIRNLDKIKLKKQGIEVLKNIGSIAPLSTKNFIISPSHSWNNLFKNSQDSVIKTLYKINQVAGINTRAYLLLDDIYRKKMSIELADSLCKNSSWLTKRMITLLSNPNVLGRYSIEQEISATALRFVRNMNISENTDNSFAGQMEYLSPEELYTFMTYGEDEIIQKSFYKMLLTLIKKSPDGNVLPIIQKLGYNNYIKFIRKCAYYDLLDTVFKPFSTDEKNLIVRKILHNLDQSSEMDAIQVADIIICLKNPAIIEVIHQQLKIEYEKAELAKSDKGVAIYGILSSLISTKIDQGWAKYVAEKYELPGLNQLPVYSLFNQKMENIQQYYFYNDEDGVGSYSNFIRSYERSPLEWMIKDLGSFVLVQSKTGRKIDIFANKAREGEKGIQAMLDYMKKNSLEPQIVVHRGLSTHTLKTFIRIPSSAKLILDGSCGGYYVQQVAIDRAPGAQILCNRNVGTMYINDPLFKQINDDIRAGKDIIWPDFWDKMNQRVGTNPYFKDYIPPHKNAAAILIKALYDILELN